MSVAEVYAIKLQRLALKFVVLVGHNVEEFKKGPVIKGLDSHIKIIGYFKFQPHLIYSGAASTEGHSTLLGLYLHLSVLISYPLRQNVKKPKRSFLLHNWPQASEGIY